MSTTGRADRPRVTPRGRPYSGVVRAEDDERTRRVLRAVRQSGEAWMSGTTWQDRSAIRISISSWATSRDDIDRTVHAFASALDDPTTARI